MINRFFSHRKIKSNTEKKRFGFWGNLPLSQKLLLAFGALFVFSIIIVVVTLTGLSRVQSNYESTLAQGIEMRRLSNQLATSLLQARDNERNFTLHWRDEGFDRAYANYVTLHMQHVADMREDLKQLAPFGPVAATVSTGDVTQAQYEADLASLTQNVDTYEKSFTALVEAHRKKGFDDSTDFEYQFRTAATHIYVELFSRATGVEQLEVNYLLLRASEYNYLAYGDQQYIVESHNFIRLLKEQFAASDQLDPATKTEMRTQADAYLTAFDGLVELDKKIASYNEELINARGEVESLAAKIENLGKQLAVDGISTAQSNSAQTFTISIATVFIVLVFSVLLAITFSQQLTRPIISLTRIAQELSAGKFDIQAQVNSADEIGILAQTFNTMTVQLWRALQNLDYRAKELEQQTLQLELTSQQSKKRAQQLQTIAEIAHYISTEKDMKKLLPLITQTVSERFGFYHVGIFLLDYRGKFAVLLASNSPGGQKMLQRQHSLEVGQIGIVGNVTATGIPRIASDTGEDAAFFNNPDLPETRSELALPLKIEKQVIGALDIQSAEINAFSNEDVEALTTLADQVSIAIQNTRLFNEIEKALAESNAIQRQYIHETWSRLPKEEKLSGFRYSIAGAIPLDNEAKISTSEDMKDKQEISVPIILRGETIGTLSVQVPKDEQVATDQMDLIKAVAERVALSAENARLFEETNRRAIREHLVSDITTRIRSTNDPQEMINTAMQELQRALGATRIEILPQKIAPPPNK